MLCAGTLTNSAGPNQTPLNAASDQGLHGWLKLQEVKGKDFFPSRNSDIDLSVLSVL